MGRRPPGRGETLCFGSSQNSKGIRSILTGFVGELLPAEVGEMPPPVHVLPALLITEEAVGKSGQSPIPAAISAGWGKSDAVGF